jgi:hypothetical protein
MSWVFEEKGEKKRPETASAHEEREEGKRAGLHWLFETAQEPLKYIAARLIYKPFWGYKTKNASRKMRREAKKMNSTRSLVATKLLWVSWYR